MLDRYTNNHHKVFMKKGKNDTWPSFINRPREDRFVYGLSHVSHLVIRQILELRLRQTANVTFKLRIYIMDKTNVKLLLFV